MEKHDELLVALRKVIRAIDLHSKKLEREVGLTGPQLLVMRAITRFDGAMVKEIADDTNLSPATITSILDRLQTRELIIRQRSTEDKRKVGVYLTENGTKALKSAPKMLQEHFIRRFDDLKDWEQSLLVSSMQRLANMMDAEQIDASPLLEIGLVNHPGAPSNNQ
ncbi:MarR family transcriptional regulator [Bowmanella sp. Y26]|uniref:MarR family winged helix-turn-helix transcriptional regulator n=1 Tax=Bowmanella yangjiangensis TaxID=2811230 RepID=UPI001BDCC62A|nr:MarR family transcriptional regulator [Bowmanella yangjiangensis]MBT1064807.1 MarR family transcriptional regulator [Bowmanella yangjiangensis]